jgi:hypothetical protein
VLDGFVHHVRQGDLVFENFGHHVRQGDSVIDGLGHRVLRGDLVCNSPKQGYGMQFIRYSLWMAGIPIDHLRGVEDVDVREAKLRHFDS